MTQVMLDRSGILAVIGELKPAGVAKHVRMHGETDLRGI